MRTEAGLGRRKVCRAAAAAILPAWSRAAGPAREVLAFYYGWYGDPAGHATWRGVDIARRRIGNAAHYPADGPYSSADPAIVARQMQQMRAAGITGLIYSWWGRSSYEDRHFQLVIDSARDHGLKVSVYYEICPKTGKVADPGAVTAELEYLIETYAAAENWLRVGKRRVFFIYAHALRQLGPEAWRAIVTAARRHHPGSVLFNADAERAAGLEFMDGIHRYALIANAGRRTPEQAASWARRFYPGYLREQARFGIRTLSVYPGYDDTHLGRANALDSGRFDGALYAALWENAAPLSPDWILITSWNEWHEGTEIEPSVEFGDTYVKLTARYTMLFR